MSKVGDALKVIAESKQDTLYHVTPRSNEASILSKGLVIGAANTSAYDDLYNIYLTSDYQDLISSGTYPEIWDHKELVVFKVTDLDQASLIVDPEYEDEDWIFMYKKNIPASKLKVHCYLTKTGQKGTTPVYSEVSK